MRHHEKSRACEVRNKMSAGPTVDPRVTCRTESRYADSREGVETIAPATNIPAEMVVATRDEIRQLAHEVAELSQRELAPEQFHAEFLQRAVKALASVAGVVWIMDGNGTPEAVARINLDAALPAAAEPAHRDVLHRAIVSQQVLTLPPRATSRHAGSTNSTDYLLIVAPLVLEDRTVGLVEVFQRANRGPATERGYAQFLTQLAEHAANYLKNHRLRTLARQQQWSHQLETFLAEIHRTLGVPETAYALVNEARRLTGFDRVSLALGEGRRCRLEVVSGLDSIDRRAQQTRQLSRLAARAVKSREPVWLGGGDDDLPPEIETCWDQYVDTSHVRRCGVLPLFPPRSEEDPASSRPPLGAIIFERLLDATADGEQEHRAHQVAHHGALALSNALAHERLFLMPLWRVLGTVVEAVGGRHFSKTLLAVIVCVASIVALTTLQSDFTVPVRGKLQPTVRRTVFAREDGIIVDVAVEHGQMVEAGQVVLQMRNTDLDVEIASLVGRQTATREQMFSLQRELLDDPRLDTGQQNRLSGELLQLRQLANSIDRQLELVREKERQLTVRSDRSGQIVTWHVRDKLLHRPVQKGQALMAVVNPAGNWELELLVPERHVRHLLRAMEGKAIERARRTGARHGCR